MSVRLENQTIYEIFRGCRLCGAGGGYKMPIIMAGLGIENYDVDLQQKILSCVQIEVRENDKMPPLICELCLDKVNDFYEFGEMCRQTNARTRKRLGLPPQSLPAGAPNADDCILGITEPVYVKEVPKEAKPKPGPASNRVLNISKVVKAESTAAKAPTLKGEKEEIKVVKSDKEKKSEEKLRWKRELEKLKAEAESSKERASRSSRRESRSSRVTSRSSSNSSRSRAASPPARPSRACAVALADSSVALRRAREQGFDSEDDSMLVPLIKRIHSENQLKIEVPSKKIKMTINLPKPPVPTSKPGPKSTRKPEPTVQKPVAEPEYKPGPKSKQNTVPVPAPKAGPKSIQKSVPEPVQKPGLRSIKKSDPEPVQIPGPKSIKKSYPEPVQKPGPKSIKKSYPEPVQKPGPKSIQKSGPNSKRLPSPPPPSPVYDCTICGLKIKAAQGLSSHLRTHHLVTYTQATLACNACGLWFKSPEGTAAHHKRHRSKSLAYHCRRCNTGFKLQMTFDSHVDEGDCIPWVATPDAQCSVCWKYFVTDTLLAQHRCGGSESRPGGKCGTCSRTFGTIKSLKKHQETCKKVHTKQDFRPPIGKPPKVESRTIADLKPQIKMDPKVRRRLKPVQVRVARCDGLLRGRKRRVDVSRVPDEYGLDKKSVYPYLHKTYKRVQIKKEPVEFRGMVNIHQELKNEFYKEEDYVHWDSDLSSDSDEDMAADDNDPFSKKRKKVDSLTCLSLKTIFSRQCLGKVPRKLRKVKSEKLFDSLFNANDETDLQDNINSIIDNLGVDEDQSVTDSAKVLFDSVSANYDSDSLLEDQDRSILGTVAGFDSVTCSINDMLQNVDANIGGEKGGAGANDTNEDHHTSTNENNNLNELNNDTAVDSTENVKNTNETGDVTAEIDKQVVKNRVDGDEDGNSQVSDKTDFENSQSDKTDLETDSQNEDIADLEEAINETTNNDANSQNNDTESPDDAINQNKDLSHPDNDTINQNNESENQNNDVNNQVNENSENTRENVNGQSEIDKSQTELDDKALLDELDAQIGESETKKDGADYEKERERTRDEKYALDDLTNNKAVSKAMELDAVSDEDFNFDI